MDDSHLSDAAKLNKLLSAAAVQSLMDYIAQDMQLKEFLGGGASKCEYFRRTESSLSCKGPFGLGEATRKQAVLRHPESREPVHAAHFRRHLDAAAHALYWALYGIPDEPPK